MKIEDYEFCDLAEPKVLNANDTAVCLNTDEMPWIAIFKEDVIALAKHFKLTADDLNKE